MKNLLELIITCVLAAYDRFMDWRSHGEWTRVRESEIPNIFYVKEQ